jgi:hypothetical protein
MKNGTKAGRLGHLTHPDFAPLVDPLCLRKERNAYALITPQAK